MLSLQLSVLVLGVFLRVTKGAEDLAFPPGFKFGVATAAYQVEGAWNVSDKSESIWDRITHTNPAFTKTQSNGDVSSDSYHNWRRDIEMITELGVQFYRFSINWPRLLPQGITNNISEDGKNYYNNLINGLLEKGIEPIVTLYHYELPQSLQNLGGWSNPLIADWFAHYARVVFTLYGDRVKTWITINEPLIMCDMAHSMDAFAPDFVDKNVALHLCSKHVLLAHAKAYRIYDEEFRRKYQYQGRVSLSHHLIWIDPLTDEAEELAELVRFFMTRFSHPVFSKEGGWPPAIENAIAEKSRAMGYPQSRLPSFSRDNIELMRGTFDFYAVNYYTSRLVRKARPGERLKNFVMDDCSDLDAIFEHNASWNKTLANWLYVYPEGLRKQLAWLKKQYGNINFLIMENGFPTECGLNDVDRITYIKEHLKQVLLSIREDGVNVTAYTAWSLMDNFEWSDAYTVKFGLYEVDSSPLRTRTARASARYYASVVSAHSLNVTDVVFHDVRVAVQTNKSEWVSWNKWLPLFGVIAVIAAAGIVFGTLVYLRRTRNRNAETERPLYVIVKTVADRSE